MLLTRRFSALNGTAVLIGAMVGLAAVAFRYAISFVEHVAFEGRIEATAQETGEFLNPIWGTMVFLIPAVGGLVVGMVRLAFPDMRRQGIAEVMAAVQARGGILRGRTAWGHAFISAVTVGSGGSAGREGPIAYIGGAIGSSMSRRLGLTARDIKVLLGAGVAPGIAAPFNAPLGGVLFAIELVLPEFSTHAFIPVVVATVIAVTVGQFFFEDKPTFFVPDEFILQSPWELLAYLLLGVLCGFGGVFFIRLMGYASDKGDSAPIPFWAKPAIGGLGVGLVGLFVFKVTSSYMRFGGEGHYHVFGTGYATVSAILRDDVIMHAVPLLLLLIIAKPIASSLTIGSGGGGGVFSASLMQGALYGALIGLGANHYFPDITAPVHAYALVGMGAFYSATGRATLTTIVLLSELTNDYTIVLPLMFAAVTADAVSVGLSQDSIYTVRLRKSGIQYEHDRTTSPLDFLLVEEVMTKDVDTLRGDLSVGEAFGSMMDQGHTGFPVVDEDGGLIGVITRTDLSKHMQAGRGDSRLSDVVSGLLITAFPQDKLYKARDRIFQQDIGRLLVVDPEDRRKLLGILTRSDLLRAEAERDVEHADAWTDDRA